MSRWCEAFKRKKAYHKGWCGIGVGTKSATKLVSISASEVDWWWLIGVWTGRCGSVVCITPLLQKALSKPVGTFVASRIVDKQRRNGLCALQRAYWNGRNQIVLDRRVRFDAFHFGLWWKIQRWSVHLANLIHQYLEGWLLHSRT